MNETSAQRLGRLLALVPWLRAHDGVTIHEAAQHFGVSDEQMTTDLWQLIVCGIPGYGPDQLVDIQFWDDDRIHVLDPIALERPLRLTGEESAALLVALRVLAQVPGSHDRAALQSAMAKLESGISSVVPSLMVDVDTATDATTADILTEAMAASQAVDITYAPGDRDLLSERRIEPRHSFIVHGRVYIEAYCHLARAVRTFRLDRMLSANLAGPASKQRAPEDEPPTDITGSVGSQRARIAVAPDASWVWDSDPVVPDGGAWGPDEWPTGTLEYASLGWLVRYALGRGGRLVIVDPPEARTAVVRQAAAKRAGMHAAGT